jgi:ABC-2 type transport system permease protein
VTVLPEWLQVFAWMLPPTYVFEGMRALLVDKVFRSDLMLQALALNAVLFAASTIAFLALLQSARKHGTLLQGGD